MSNKMTAVGRPLSAGPAKAAPVHRTPACHMRMHEEKLPANLKVLPAERHRIHVPKEGDQYNPTICIDANGDLRTILRVHRGPPGTRTINFTGVVNNRWVLNDPQIVLSRRDSGQIEDLRLFMWKEQLWATAVQYMDYRTEMSTIHQALLELTPDGGEVVSTHIQSSPRNEKNWMPYVTEGGDLRLVYSTDPLVVLDVQDTHVSPNVGSLRQVMGFIRGGTQLVPWRDEGSLAIVHQVYSPKVQNNPMMSDFWTPSASSIYVHRFAKFDRELTHVRFSRPFIFMRQGIEFCAGLVHHDGRFIASVGIADKEPWLFEIEEEVVEAMLGGIGGGAGI